MPTYAAEFNRTLSTTASWGSFGASNGTQTRRLVLAYLSAGNEGAAADASIALKVQRYTAAGTSTAVTPSPIDLADPAMLGVAGENHTGEPTYTAGLVMLAASYHHRVGFVYYAPPDIKITVPATNAAGLGIQTPTINGTGTTASTCFVHIQE